MIHSTDNLGRHISRGPTSFISIFFPPFSCHSEISYSHIASLFEYDVLGLQISVDDIFRMNVFKGLNNATHNKFYD